MIRRRRAVSVGGLTAALSRASPSTSTRFYIDRHPVTNAEFKKFLDATHYHPKDDHNFLRDWKDGNYPDGMGEQAGDVGFHGRRARLCDVGPESVCPTNGNGNMPPKAAMAARTLGATIGTHSAVPAPDKSRTWTRPDPVDALSQGRQSVWRDGHSWKHLAVDGRVRDPHTRAAIVRGGAAYQPRGSVWYFPQTYRLDEHEKYF